MDGSAPRRPARPDDELFIDQLDPRNQHGQAQDLNIGPLRISKTGGTTSPPPRTGSASSATQFYQQASQSQYGAPPTQPPTGPLPYPDERSRPHAAAYRAGSTPGPAAGRQTPDQRPAVGGAAAGAGAGAGPSPRARFTANDPNRPTAAGYGAHSTGPGQASAAPLYGERRNEPSRPQPVSPDQDTDGLFQKPLNNAAVGQRRPTDPPSGAIPNYQQQYYPPPGGNSSGATKQESLAVPADAGMSRFDSVSTVRAQRGSPPPPETPIVPPPGAGIEARFAASGIGGPDTGIAPSAAASQRAAQYPMPPSSRLAGTSQPAGPTPQPQRRPWTPTEQPGTQPFGAPTVYQGMNEVGAGQATSPPRLSLNTGSGPGIGASTNPFMARDPAAGAAGSSAAANQRPEHPLEHDMSRMHMSEEPPPAYSSVTPAGRTAQGYPNEKAHPAGAAAAATIASPQPSSMPGTVGGQQHPAFANDPRAASASPSQAGSSQQPANASPAPASIPPLPEGWIAHLDPKSGHYYYIHIPTHSTQWEFPKGPTPLAMSEPLSPTGTFVNPFASPTTSKFPTFNNPLASPGLPTAQSATYRPETMLSMGGLQTPTAAGFTGPPPSAGVDMYKVAPTNGVYFGPYLRYTNMDVERGLWIGSIMLITDAAQPPTIHIHKSVDLSPNPHQLKPHPIFSHQRWIFFRYDVELRMEDQSAKWTYAVTSHLGCTRYEFLVAGRHETSWRFISHSGNDFSMNVNVNERAKLGGVGYMWKDILQKHIECNGFHAQLGLGGLINADRMWKEVPLLKQWTATSGKENRKNAQWTPKHEDDVTHAYFHYYTSHLDQPHLREAFAQIPHVLSLDDHDIFDGFGSYPDYMQQSNMFKNIGRIGIDMYLLFQHHTTTDILRNVGDDMDLFTITGNGWHFIKYLGPSVVVVGPDTRSERNGHQIMAGPTYQGLFPKVAVLPPSVQHCIWMIPVPIVYPRLESMEHLASTVATGKKAVTGAFNMVGKVTGSVAGIVGAKGAVGDGFNAVKKAVGKSGLMSSVLSPFGEIDMLDELRDQWTHESKDLERTYLIRTLQGISHNKSLRMTFLSGAVHSSGAGLLHDPSHPQDHKTMYQLITSPLVDAPTSSYILRLLHNNKPLYVPLNGHRSNNNPSDTKEDMMEIFAQDAGGQPRENKRLMARRNYCAMVVYDPEIVQGAFGQNVGPGGPSHGGGGGKLSLAVDFMVQGDLSGAPMGAGCVKYGPVVIPSLEYGR